MKSKKHNVKMTLSKTILISIPHINWYKNCFKMCRKQTRQTFVRMWWFESNRFWYKCRYFVWKSPNDHFVISLLYNNGIISIKQLIMKTVGKTHLWIIQGGEIFRDSDIVAFYFFILDIVPILLLFKLYHKGPYLHCRH